ncbi:MAG TPA: family 1 glycosylhydrolase [Elusimicrobiota bacterium]|nr:family 1 glycosylhydrolase [Elusimicrobiota bacterium]
MRLATILLFLLAVSPARGQDRFEAPFFFGLASAPGQSEDQLPDIWMDWANRGKVAAYANQAAPEKRLEFWTKPEVELDLAAKTGISVYRMGVDWGRVMPRRHEFDEAAIARYHEILKMVKARHMKVMLTLMHHSVPRWAQQRGGWLDDGMKDDYLEFARRMIDEFNPDVEYWVTFNEANVFAPLAYTNGLWPPGGRNSIVSLVALGPFKGETVRAMDRMSDAHDELYDWAHKKYPAIRLGIAQNMALYTGKAWYDRIAARFVDALMNWRFPERLRGRMDYFGINYYGAEWIRDGALALEADEEYSEAGRAVNPRGFYTTLMAVHRRFPTLPIIVTENGIADSTDVLRPAYLLEHLAAIAQARRDGAPVAGYIEWTLSDNLEWADGYCPKFGLAAVDRAHGLKRIPRPSYDLFRRIVATREVTAAMRDEAWVNVSVRAGQDRPFCRADDAVTPLSEPKTRKISSTDWRFR